MNRKREQTSNQFRTIQQLNSLLTQTEQVEKETKQVPVSFS